MEYEKLPLVVAICYHPDNHKYWDKIGTSTFVGRVPMIADRRVDFEGGTLLTHEEHEHILRDHGLGLEDNPNIIRGYN